MSHYFVLLNAEGFYFTGGAPSRDIDKAFRYSTFAGAWANARGSETPVIVEAA